MQDVWHYKFSRSCWISMLVSRSRPEPHFPCVLLFLCATALATPVHPSEFSASSRALFFPLFPFIHSPVNFWRLISLEVRNVPFYYTVIYNSSFYLLLVERRKRQRRQGVEEDVLRSMTSRARNRHFIFWRSPRSSRDSTTNLVELLGGFRRQQGEILGKLEKFLSLSLAIDIRLTDKGQVREEKDVPTDKATEWFAVATAADRHRRPTETRHRSHLVLTNRNGRHFSYQNENLSANLLVMVFCCWRLTSCGPFSTAVCWLFAKCASF